MSAQVRDLTGDLAAQRTSREAFVNLAVQRQRTEMVVDAPTDVAVERSTCGGGDTDDEGHSVEHVHEMVLVWRR